MAVKAALARCGGRCGQSGFPLRTPLRAALAERVRAQGASVELEILPGRGHDMDLAFFRSEALVAFVLRHAR